MIAWMFLTLVFAALVMRIVSDLRPGGTLERSDMFPLGTALAALILGALATAPLAIILRTLHR